MFFDDVEGLHVVESGKLNGYMGDVVGVHVVESEKLMDCMCLMMWMACMCI